MERTKYRLIIILFGLVSLSLKGNYRNDVYNSYINNRMPVWKSIIDQMNNLPEKSNELILELVNYQYGYIGWCLGTNRKEEGFVYLKLAEANIQLLEEDLFEPAIINAYKSALYGFRISLSKFSAPFNGPKSSEFARLAVKLGPREPFGYIQLGNVMYHTPPMLGGSKTKAIAFYLQAKALMDKKKEDYHGDWNYLSLSIMIAQAYESANNYEKAKSVYEEILKFDPGFMWVKEELYPGLLKKMGKKN